MVQGIQQQARLDPAEVERFSRMAADWWNPDGKFRPLHQLNPVRLGFIRDEACRRLGREARSGRALAGLSALDIGCGGGLVAEPLTRMGARVTGIDPSPETVAIARSHADQSGLAIDYRQARVEDLVAAGEAFDLVTCLEVVEHVPDVPGFLAVVARCVRPGGVLVVSTLNRTLKSFALAIVGAEYVLGWLPRGTHQWDRFVTPEELEVGLAAAGLANLAVRGIAFDPLSGAWLLAGDTDVNYIVAATRGT